MFQFYELSKKKNPMYRARCVDFRMWFFLGVVYLSFSYTYMTYVPCQTNITFYFNISIIIT